MLSSTNSVELLPKNNGCGFISESFALNWYIFVAFLVKFTDQDKQLPQVKPLFKSLNRIFSVQEIYRFITFLKAVIILLIKQFPLNFTTSNGRESVKVGAKNLSDVVIF